MAITKARSPAGNVLLVLMCGIRKGGGTGERMWPLGSRMGVGGHQGFTPPMPGPQRGRILMVTSALSTSLDPSNSPDLSVFIFTSLSSSH